MNRTTLLVAVRGWCSRGDALLAGQPGGEIPDAFVQAIEGRLSHVEVWRPELDMSMFSMKSPERLSQDLLDQLDRAVAARPHVSSIVILGFSAGSVLARRVFCMAHGAAPDATVSQARRRAWASLIDRMVVLSGITRGWEFSTASPALTRFFGPFYAWLTRLMGYARSLVARERSAESDGNTPFIWKLFRGAPFVVATRLQYLAVLDALKRENAGGAGAGRSTAPGLRSEGIPSTVFLLGSRDEFVSPADCTELGPRAEFLYLELLGSNHLDVLRIHGGDAPSVDRREKLLAAIDEPFTDLAQRYDWVVLPQDIDDYVDPLDLSDSGRNVGDAERVRAAVIVLHGIRDNGFWTKRVAREIKRLARRDGIAVRAATPSYGFFSMWDFVRPRGREQATYWFLERYAEVKTYFPNAEVSFVGHSNGTYIAARALEICEAVRFKHVVLAGSVVRCGFEWYQHAGRVEKVLNYIGSRDAVVACLPGLFEALRLRWLDVGGAGAYGFTPGVQALGDDVMVELKQVKYVSGGHGAAIGEDFWTEIARFALKGDYPQRAEDPRPLQTRVLLAAARVATPFLLILAALLIASPVIMLLSLASDVPTYIALALALMFASWLLARALRQL